MIIDSLKSASRYFSLQPAFRDAFAFLEREDILTLEDGRYEIDGDEAFCLVSRNPGKSVSQARLEIHRKFVDVHYLIEGEEAIGWKSAAECEHTERRFDGEKDFGVYADAPLTYVHVKPGMFVICFPEDAHAPLVSGGLIHKAVLKVAVRTV